MPLLPLGHIALHQKRKYQPDPTPLAEEEVSIPITSSCVQKKSSIVTEASGFHRMRFATRTGTFCGSWQGMPTAHSWSPFGARQSDQTVGPIVKDLASPCKRWEIEDVEGYMAKGSAFDQLIQYFCWQEKLPNSQTRDQPRAWLIWESACSILSNETWFLR